MKLQVFHNTIIPSAIYDDVKKLHKICFDTLYFSFKPLLDSHHILFVLSESQRNIGYAYTTIRNKTIVIDRLCIDPQYRSKKHGSRFLAKMIMYLRQKYKDKEKIYLMVKIKNTGAIRFYEKNHFVIEKLNEKIGTYRMAYRL